MTTQTIKPRGDLVERAKMAYFARCTRTGVLYQQPSNCSCVQEYDGKSYVVLENIHGPLAVYRVCGDGRLEFVREEDWPDVLEAAERGNVDDAQAVEGPRASEAGVGTEERITHKNAALAARERALSGHVYVPRKGLVPESELTLADYRALLERMRKPLGNEKTIASIEAKIAALAERSAE